MLKNIITIITKKHSKSSNSYTFSKFNISHTIYIFLQNHITISSEFFSYQHGHFSDMVFNIEETFVDMLLNAC